MITTKVMRVTTATPFSPAWDWSANSGPAPVTYALIPGGAGTESTILRTARADSFARPPPMLPARYTWT